MKSKEQSFLVAAAAGHVRKVAALLEAGVDVNVQDSRGLPSHRTALMHAAEKGRLKVVDLLIKADARINAIDKGFSIDCPGGNTALILAIQNRHVEIAHRLLRAGASPRTKGGGTSVINAAAYVGDVALVKRLLELGADPRQRDGSGFTPIYSAVLNGHVEIVRRLLDLGVDASSSGPGHGPILIDAASGGKAELCKLLVDRGANPAQGDERNFTPLMMACRAVKPGVVRFLLSVGVNPNAQDSRRRTALDIATDMQRPPAFAPDVLERLTKLGQITLPSAGKLRAIVSMLRKAGGKTIAELFPEVYGPIARKTKEYLRRLELALCAANLSRATVNYWLAFFEKELSNIESRYHRVTPERGIAGVLITATLEHRLVGERRAALQGELEKAMTDSFRANDPASRRLAAATISELQTIFQRIFQAYGAKLPHA